MHWACSTHDNVMNDKRYYQMLRRVSDCCASREGCAAGVSPRTNIKSLIIVTA